MWKEIKKKTEKYGWILALFGIIPDVWFFYELFEKIKHNMNNTYLLGISGILSGLSIVALIFWLWYKIEKRKPKGTCLLLPPNDKFEALVLGINEKIKYLIEDFAISHRSSFKHIESQGHNIDTNSVGYYMRADNEPDKTIKDIQKMVYDHNYFEKTPYIDCIKELDKPFNSILKIIDKYKDKIAAESEIPIVDSEKLRSLLSEITPYRFVIIKDNTINQRERKNCDIEKPEEQSAKQIEDFFQGKWTNTYSFPTCIPQKELFEIYNGAYYIDGKKRFEIVNFLTTNGKLSFEKKWLSGNFKNKIVKLDEVVDGGEIHYKGKEIDGDNILDVVYRKLDTTNKKGLEQEIENQPQDMSILADNMPPINSLHVEAINVNKSNNVIDPKLITPDKIKATFCNAPLLQRTHIAAQYFGLRVQWEGSLYSINLRSQNVATIEIKWNNSIFGIFFDLDTTQNNGLGILNRGEFLKVDGTIKEISEFYIILAEAKLILNAADDTLKKNDIDKIVNWKQTQTHVKNLLEAYLKKGQPKYLKDKKQDELLDYLCKSKKILMPKFFGDDTDKIVEIALKQTEYINGAKEYYKSGTDYENDGNKMILLIKKHINNNGIPMKISNNIL